MSYCVLPKNDPLPTSDATKREEFGTPAIWEADGQHLNEFCSAVVDGMGAGESRIKERWKMDGSQ